MSPYYCTLMQFLWRQVHFPRPTFSACSAVENFILAA
jgi:hypothetical protein